MNYFFEIQEIEKKCKVEKMKQKRWQEKYCQFMFGIQDDDGNGNDNIKLQFSDKIVVKFKLDWFLLRFLSIVSLQKIFIMFDGIFD